MRHHIGPDGGVPLAQTPAFDAFLAVDWSGSRDPRTVARAVQVAEYRRGEAPRLIAPDTGWSRRRLLDHLIARAASDRILVGFDFGFAFPFIDVGAYFPGIEDQPADARALWDWIEDRCRQDGDFGIGDFFNDPAVRRYFLGVGSRGVRFMRRFRLSEHICQQSGQGNAQSMFHLIGPNQVGKASISGIRLLRSAASQFDIWPFDRPRAGRSVIVELYTGHCIRSAGEAQRNIRDPAVCARALRALGVAEACDIPDPLSDHQADALIASVALARYAADPACWRPACLSDKVRRSEGWIFGVR